MAQQPNNDARIKPHGEQTGGPDAHAGGEASPAARDAGAAADAGAEAVHQTARAGREALQANSEILRTNIETAQQAARSSLETTAQSLDQVSQTFLNACGLGSPRNEQAAQQSSQDVKAVSVAASALVRGAQDVSNQWLELVQRSVKSNFDVIGQFAGCRSVGDVASLQSRLMRETLQQAVQTGRNVAQSSIRTMDEAGRAFS